MDYTADETDQPLGPRLPIEIGIVLSGMLDPVDRQAVAGARQLAERWLREQFPEFDWRLSTVRRPEFVTEARLEPVSLLQRGREERDAAGLDFAMLVTAADLIAHHRPFALAVVSRALDLAVLSTARIDPSAVNDTVEESERIELMARRLSTLLLHALGHLNGLSHAEEPDSVMREPEAITDLEQMQTLSDGQRRAMRHNLGEIADARLEEQTSSRRLSSLRFYLRGMWINRHEVTDAVLQAEPWQFPIRLARLTTAAVSSMLVLMITAETWDLALSQSPASLVALFSVVLAVTTAYILVRHRLLVRRSGQGLTEQLVITNVSTVLIVLLGFVSTAVLMFLGTLLLGWLLFGLSLITSWAASVEGEIGFGHYGQMAAFVASLGLLIAALGASFEEQNHFRHITFVDEET